MLSKVVINDASEFEEELKDRKKQIGEMNQVVVSWFCNDNNRVINKLLEKLSEDDMKIVNDKIQRISNIVINELCKMSEEYGIFFWDIYDAFTNAFLINRLPVIHSIPDEIIPQDYKEWKAAEERMRERVKLEREMLKDVKGDKMGEEI